MIRVATDVGGTFTDLVYFEIDKKTKKAKKISNAKSDTTTPNYEKGVFKAIKKSGISIDEAIFFAHGTTVIINSITERKGSVTGLITTKGFRDSLEIARGDRPDFFNLRYKKPEPFIPRYLRAEVLGRMDFLGKEIEKLELNDLNKIIKLFKSHKVKSIAICLLHSYANPKHEQVLAKKIKQKWPEFEIVTSNELTREWREYERTNTTALYSPVESMVLSRLPPVFAFAFTRRFNFRGKPLLRWRFATGTALDPSESLG